MLQRRYTTILKSEWERGNWSVLNAYSYDNFYVEAIAMIEASPADYVISIQGEFDDDRGTIISLDFATIAREEVDQQP